MRSFWRPARRVSTVARRSRLFWRAGIKNAARQVHTTHVRSFAPGVVEELGEIDVGAPGAPRGKYAIIWSSQDRAGCWPPTSGIRRLSA